MFLNNTAAKGGGAVHVKAATPTLTRCTFTGNRATDAVEGAGGAIWYQDAPVRIQVCTFTRNVAATAGGAVCRIVTETGGGLFTECTLAENSAPLGGGIYDYCEILGTLTVDHTIIAFSPNGEAVACDGLADPVLTCCDVYGNEGGDWVGCLLGQDETDGNLHADPIFCGEHEPEAPWTVRSDSPCGPDYNPECGRIGAWPVGCYPSGTGDQTDGQACRLVIMGHPNPSPGAVHITYQSPRTAVDARVQVELRDISGRLIRPLSDAVPHCDRCSIEWDGMDSAGKDAPSGMYFLLLRAAGRVATERVLLLR